MYRMTTGKEVRNARSDKEEDEVERLGKIVHEYFPELTEKYFCIPEPYTQGGYIFNFFIDEETNGMYMMYEKSVAWNNKIMNMKPDELISYMKYKIIQAAKKAKQLKMDQIKTCGGDYEV